VTAFSLVLSTQILDALVYFVAVESR